MARSVEDILREQLGHLSIQLAFEVSKKEQAQEEVARLTALLPKKKKAKESDGNAS